jgi:adenosylcobinamide-phosphate synthase
MSELFKNPLLIGFLLDTLIGDPYKLPHPIRWFGNVISFGEKRLNQGSNRKLKGALMAVVQIFSVWATLFFGLKLIEPFETATLIVSSILVFYGLANHTLIAEALKVERKLSNEGLDAGRKQLSFIVGRDTSNLNENQIRTAVLETLAENLSDGVIAPLFFYALGGIPLMFAYKMVNTLDSMIGYKSDRYKDFGWFAARTDDWANLIPARLTASLMVLVTFSFRGAKFVFKFGRKHASPNSGYPESAMAGILNLRFGGPNVYHGQLVEKPYIGTNARNILRRDLYKACVVNGLVAIVAVVVILALSSFFPH